MMGRFLAFFRRYKSLAILIVVFAAASVGSPAFLTVSNMRNLFLRVAIQGIIGFGMTFALIAGEFDMSVGSVLTLSGICFAKFLQTMAFLPAVLLVLAIGGVIGILNGTIIARLRLSSFIGTLGAMYAYKGVALMLSQGNPVKVSDPFALAVSNLRIYGNTVFPMLFILIGLVCWYVLARTRLGRNIYATGGNAEVATNSGINVRFYKTISFVFVVTSAALAGILMTIRLQSATPIAGDDTNLVVVSSVIIGGTSPAGGTGSIPESFLGLLIIGVVTIALDIMNISGYYQQVVQGFLTVVIIGASSYANYRKVSSI